MENQTMLNKSKIELIAKYNEACLQRDKYTTELEEQRKLNVQYTHKMLMLKTEITILNKKISEYAEIATNYDELTCKYNRLKEYVLSTIVMLGLFFIGILLLY